MADDLSGLEVNTCAAIESFPSPATLSDGVITIGQIKASDARCP